MGMKDSAKALGARFKLDSHHAIERFGVVFAVVVLSCLTIFSATAVSAFSNNRETLSATALYTPKFVTSKTQISGEVPGIFVSEDRTRAMVLMHFANTSQVSVNAEDYRAFLTGSTKDLNSEDLKTEVNGSIYVFGSTGYMGVLLDSAEPFSPQIMDLTMRSASELVYKEEAAAVDKDLATDSTFQKYDQWRVFFNPGGSEATVSAALGADQVDVGAIFNEVVVAAEEKQVRASLDAQLALMKTDLNRISDATAELERTSADGGTLRLLPPEVPASIAGDVIEGAAQTGETESTLDLQTDYVMALGYDFDWRGGNVREGYLKDLIPSGSNYVSYLAERADEEPEEFRVNQIRWMLDDGTDLQRDYASSSGTVKPLTDIMNKLSTAYQDYYSHKQTYQVDLHNDLLDLEVNLRNVESNFTQNGSEEAVLTY